MSPTELREAIEWLDACLRELHQTPEGELRSLDADEQTRFDEGLAMRQTYAAELERHNTISRLSEIPAHVETTRKAPEVSIARDPIDVLEDRSATPSQLADAVTRSLEDKVEAPENMAHVRSVLKRHSSDRDWARGILARSTDVYASAWWKVVNGRDFALTSEERTALGVSTNANGAYLLPTHLDPTIILTNAGSNNIVRQLARNATLTQGETWHGVTSAGVTASWDGELAEVSDDSPTFSTATVTVGRAQAFVQAAISATEDIAGLAGDVLMMFADARDRLEGAAFCTGVGTGATPKGIFTALNANTNVQVTSTTAATIGLVDLQAIYKKVPRRFRGNGAFLMHPDYHAQVQALGTALSASYSTNLTEPWTERIFGKPVYESDDCPNTQTTTALDNEIVYGDFSNYLIVDKPGSMSVEYIPHLFNTANNLPDGRRGWYATWRTGGNSLVDTAFALLVDKTTA